MKPSILYKIHENLDCDILLKLVRYLNSIGYDIRPLNIIERKFPNDITFFPTIIINNAKIEGIDNIIFFYENLLKIKNLKEFAKKFALNNPKYRVSNRSTQKILI